MKTSSYVIVHGKATMAIRRVIADDDGQVTVVGPPSARFVQCTHPGRPPSRFALLPGEDAIRVVVTGAPSDAHKPQHWKQAIKDQFGVDPPDVTCALVNGSNVVEGIVAADPNIDASPDPALTMVQRYSTQIAVGHIYDPGTGLFSIPGGVLPPHSPGNSGDAPINVPPVVIP